MPNKQHVDIIKSGVDIWNKWKDDNYVATVDLKKAKLSKANLSGADLYKANLSEANLSGADLKKANLSEANLSEANLQEANLSEANLIRTNFNRANLCWTNLFGADLFGADLGGASLCWANLFGADLRGVDLFEANLTGADLNGVNLSRVNLGRATLSVAHLCGANLFEAHLSGAHLWGANLKKANLSGATLGEAYLIEANLSGADLSRADLNGAHLWGANLSGADLNGANLSGADLKKANLSEANLLQAIFVNTILEEANLTGCYIYGISAWDIKLNEKTIQSDLIITKKQEPKITVDNLEVAQFIYLLLNNKKIRHVIDTITSKVVLILGRFTSERKAVLDAIREKLRKFDYLPILFDFENSENRDITETISLLARMARFVIADITDAKSIPQELMCIVPHLPSVPVQPLLQAGKDEYGMFEHFKKYPWVLKIYQYRDLNYLLGSFEEKVIFPAEAKAKKLIKK